MAPHRSSTKTQTLQQLCRTIGVRVREERRRHGLTQEELAEKTDLSANYIAHVERASRGISLDTLVALAKVFGVPAYSLLKPARRT
jgi:transcriptional regulator with XRE-family HTH domain